MWVNDNVKELRIPENFEIVAPIHDEQDPPQSRKQRKLPDLSKLIIAPFYDNPQTKTFCEILEIDVSKMPR
jgi:hypothetical protein